MASHPAAAHANSRQGEMRQPEGVKECHGPANTLFLDFAWHTRATSIIHLLIQERARVSPEDTLSYLCKNILSSVSISDQASVALDVGVS